MRVIRNIFTGIILLFVNHSFGQSAKTGRPNWIGNPLKNFINNLKMQLIGSDNFYTKCLQFHEMTVNVEDLSVGTYFVKLNDRKTSVNVKFIVKNN